MRAHERGGKDVRWRGEGEDTRVRGRARAQGGGQERGHKGGAR